MAYRLLHPSTVMFSRLCAAWLIAIITLPFTAPLATCDLADILHSAPAHGSNTPLHAPAADGSTSIPPVLATTEGRLRLDLVADAFVGTRQSQYIFVLNSGFRAVLMRVPRPHDLSRLEILRV